MFKITRQHLRVFLEYWGIYVIVLVGLFLITIWFRQGLPIVYGEYGEVLIRPDRWLEEVRYVWNSSYGTGVTANFVRNNFMLTPFFFGINYLSKVLTIVAIQRLMFAFLMITGGLSMYALAYSASKDKDKRQLIGTLAGLFYMLNPYAMLGVWNRFTYSEMFTYASLPLMLFLLIRGLEKERLIYVIYLLAGSLVYYLSYSHPAHVVTQWLVIMGYLAFFLMVNIKNKEKAWFACKFMALYGILWGLFHFWWILPLLRTYKNIVTIDTALVNINTLIEGSKHLDLYYVVRLLQSGDQYMLRGWGLTYSSLPFQVISWLILVIVLVGVVRGYKNRAVWFFTGMSIVSLFITKGLNPPFGNLLLKAIKLFPLLGMFRDTWGKIGIVIPICYSFLFGAGLAYLFYYLKKRTVVLSLASASLVTILVFIVFPWPMWTGEVFKGSRTSESQSIPQYVKKPVFITIPWYYEKADKWISRDKEDFRILHLPLSYIDWVVYDWPRGYHGFLPENILFAKSSITGYQWTPMVDNLYRDIGRELYTSDFWKIMALFNVKYIVLHNDVNAKESITDSPHKIKEALKNTERLDTANAVYVLGPGMSEGFSNWETDPEDIHMQWEKKDTIGGKDCLHVRGYPRGRQLGLNYEVSIGSRDWSGKQYLVVWMKSNVPLKLFMAIKDNKKDDYISWNGKEESQYCIEHNEINEWKRFILPMYRPSNVRQPSFDQSNITEFYLSADHLDPKKKVDLKIGDISIAPIESSQTEGVSYKRSFGELEVYGIDSSCFTEHIYSTSRFSFSKSQDRMFEDIRSSSFIPGDETLFVKDQLNVNETRFLKGLDQRQMQKPKIMFKRVNSAKYTVKVTNASKPFLLVFSETYNSEWVATRDRDKAFRHFVANGYANAYYVPDKGSYEIMLEYRPARLFFLSSIVSLVAIGGTIICCAGVGVFTRRRINKE